METGVIDAAHRSCCSSHVFDRRAGYALRRPYPTFDLAAGQDSKRIDTQHA